MVVSLLHVLARHVSPRCKPPGGALSPTSPLPLPTTNLVSPPGGRPRTCGILNALEPLAPETKAGDAVRHSRGSGS
ncbi:hypothetical protein D187_003419 [Cystobacter fuscus DSM 2262]|uniref:Uncharacterized protein n=1 Tax=Cystobacter fuscus (strain ATCC 25194 / DSM 2262 / NBRC 100088 / M29) TaxID=1242864 RepID=S9P9U2_CYSF2|nr:hypothetical protein D187_003419 [Cystobacter fuscus DSM 2262]